MYYIGIDLGGTYIKAGLVDEQGNIIYKTRIPTRATEAAEVIVADMAQLAHTVIKESGVNTDDIESIGIGSPGTCDSKNGILVYANNINFKNVPIRDMMQKHIDLPVFIGNDANCAAWGEYCMLPEKVNDIVFITLGTGVGGGAVIGGKLYEGFNGAAMEVGHTLLLRGGELCTCGRRGCFEAYASVTALVRMTREYIAVRPHSTLAHRCGQNILDIDGKTAFDAARDGDEGGKEIIYEWTKYVAEGLVDIINLFQPQYLIIGGAVSHEGDFLLNPIKEHISAYRYTRDSQLQTRIQISSCGNDAGLIGAAFLGR